MKICIDAGHGGSDSGADGPTGLNEASVVLEISQMIAEALVAQYHETKLTRTMETYVSLDCRCKIANDWEAHYFISVHCNSDGPTAVGIETLYKSENGKDLASYIQDELIRVTGDIDRGLKHRDNLQVLNGTNMPAVLVEVGFISHPGTEAKLKTKDYKTVLANAITKGFLNFMEF